MKSERLDRLREALERVARGRVALKVKEVAVAFGISTGTVNKALRDGELSRFKFGSRTLILVTDIEAWLQGMKQS